MQIPQNVEMALTPKQKNPKTHNIYWWCMVYVKSSRGLTPLKRTKIIKKAQERKDEIKKKLYEYNMWWND